MSRTNQRKGGPERWLSTPRWKQGTFWCNAEVTWLDREGVARAVRQAAQRLARRHPEIAQIILFGSLARGDAVPGSDVDLLIILTSHSKPFLDQIPEYRPPHFSVGVDVFPYTEAEFGRMLADGNPFVKNAVGEGIVLFERSPRGDPRA